MLYPLSYRGNSMTLYMTGGYPVVPMAGERGRPFPTTMTGKLVENGR